MEALAQAAVSQFGRIDVWVNNAGGGALGRFEDVPLADHVHVIETDLLGTLYGSYFALRQFQGQGAVGTLINIASVIGKVPAPYFASYAAAKHGVVGLSGAIRQELEQNNVRASTSASSSRPRLTRRSLNTPPTTPATGPSPSRLFMTRRKSLTPSSAWRRSRRTRCRSAPPARLTTVFHNLFPGLTEKLMATQTHTAQMKKAEPAPDTEAASTPRPRRHDRDRRLARQVDMERERAGRARRVRPFLACAALSPRPISPARGRWRTRCRRRR